MNNLKNDFDIGAKDVDLVIGGPPCQAYSTLGKRNQNDPRAFLFYEYYRVLNELKPSVFIFENVKGLLSINKGKLFEIILNLFESLGYRVYFKILNAVDYGIPQFRERVIIVGSKRKASFHFPAKVQNKNYLTVEDALSDLPFIKSNTQSFIYKLNPQNEFQKMMRLNAPSELQDHIAPNHNDSLIKLMELLPDGGTPLDIPEANRPKSGFSNTYSRLWWNRPSTTITRNFGTPSSSRCIHPKVARALTTREGARLQSFPDSYQFFGSRSDKNLQIGNAVPPLLSIALSRAVKEHFLIF